VEESVARYSQEHKEATRKRIIETAGRRFKQDGIDSSGVATLMADAGLTNGAFYAHFASKDDLVASVIEEELRLQAQAFGALPDGLAGVEQLVRAYLSPEHRDHRDLGCTSAALLDEIGRSTDAAKEAYTAGTQTVVEEIAIHLDPDDPEAAHGRALILFTMIVGTLQVSRAVVDRQVSDETLAQGVRHALALLGIEQNG
jgi:TetR/AcrR family transcriptional regulator, transcriptional repressor for nem operon